MALNQLTASQQKPNIYFDDHDFEAGQTSDNDLLEDVRRSAIFLAVVSPAYVAPDKFTLKELNTFCGAYRESKIDHPPVFSIDFLPIDTKDRPAELRTIKRNDFFWTNENNAEVPFTHYHPDFMPKICTIAKQIKGRLDRIRIESGGIVVEPIKPKTSYSEITVLLGQVTDDLVDTREELRDYLEKLGTTVLPRSDYLDWGSEFVRDFEPMIASCQLFIQLLSKVRSTKRPDEASSCALFQYDRAVAVGKELMLWRDLSDISRVSHYDKFTSGDC
jgi:hypothetical protein